MSSKRKPRAGKPDRGPFVTGRNIDVSPSCGSGNRAKSHRPRYDYSFLASNRAAVLAAAKHNGRACARPLRSQCCYLHREPGSHRITGASPDSGFDIQSDLFLAIPTSSELSMSICNQHSAQVTQGNQNKRCPQDLGIRSGTQPSKREQPALGSLDFLIEAARSAKLLLLRPLAQWHLA